LREWLYARRFRKALERALPAELRPLLDKPFFQVTAGDINKLRLALDAEWQAFCAMRPAKKKYVKAWMAKTSSSSDVDEARRLKRDAIERFD